MLTELIHFPLETLVMGARKHAMLATDCGEAVPSRFEMDDWTCHVCRTRIQGFMEIDHLHAHVPCEADRIRTICQFCHNLRHPVWAGLRGRLRLIWAPDVDQATVTRIAWQILFARTAENPEDKGAELAEASGNVVGDVTRRERVLENILGSANVEAFFEALFAAKSLMPQTAFQSVVSRLDKFVRFWPTAAGWDRAGVIPASSALSCWRDGRFKDLSVFATHEYLQCEIESDCLDNLAKPGAASVFLGDG